MRLLALLACSACVYTSVDSDGKWSSLDDPCVPIGPTKKLVETRFSVIALPAGDTLLYSAGENVSQLDVETGESTIVLRSDAIWQFAIFGDDVVYYESNGDSDDRSSIDLIVDHGARSSSRYERISPRHGYNHAGLLTTRHGIYFWTTPSLDLDSGKEEWRWVPETGAIEPFTLQAASIVRSDDDSFFYVDAANRLVVRPQLPGPPTLIEQMPIEAPQPFPIAIDGDELFYAKYSFESDSLHELVVRDSDGERTLLTNRFITGGAIDDTYLYFTEDPNDSAGIRESLYRIPRSGGPIETVFTGEPNSAVFEVLVDRCNVYWQQFTVDGGAIYGREITQ